MRFLAPHFQHVRASGDVPDARRRANQGLVIFRGVPEKHGSSFFGGYRQMMAASGHPLLLAVRAKMRTLRER